MVRNYCRAEQRMMLQCVRCSCCGDDGDGPLFFALQLNKEQRQRQMARRPKSKVPAARAVTDRAVLTQLQATRPKPRFVLSEIF